MQPVGESQPPVSSVSEIVRTHLQKRRYLASLETDATERFQQVSCRRMHPCDINDLTVSISMQVSSLLENARSRKSKWTLPAERALLCEYWGRMARKAPRSFAFDGFSER